MDFSEVLGLINSVLESNTQNGSKVSDIERVFNDVTSELSLIQKESREDKGRREITVDEKILHRFNEVINQLNDNRTSGQKESEVKECQKLTTLYEIEAELGRKIEGINAVF
ncbi:unnamed protein product [Bursaphelenchus xylophilus]|uniref:(pine wood nematode) hypothetical protein n=1 Tax=Bursaphelenchus xylophilus TaxID=6326 RepID=A0A1I7RQ33_BURXY|nr:unnamed protein product [Bursaphelenchus xylophilus]CAG9097074.1 unnamed protein product [Bursaphelenchus xylophilus]